MAFSDVLNERSGGVVPVRAVLGERIWRLMVCAPIPYPVYVCMLHTCSMHAYMQPM